MIYEGIDVSHHNGWIDWDKVANSGIKFAMIRCGYGNDIKSQDDKYFERNFREAKRVGLYVGVYLYSYALNMADAQSELDHALRLIADKTFDFPFSFDMEDADHWKENHGMPSDAMLVNICNYVLDGVEDIGRYVSLYANLHWLRTKLDSPKLDRYDKWLAEWDEEPDYNGIFRMWQYTGFGHVSGVSGYVDRNESYSDFQFGGNKHQTQSFPYTINKGDTLWDIAQRFRTSVSDILAVNPEIEDKDMIYPNETIRIPRG